jgi:hypothetical protein
MTFPWGVAAGDVNGDGKSDIVTANAAASGVSILLNTTPFTAPPPGPGTGSPGVTVTTTVATTLSVTAASGALDFGTLAKGQSATRADSLTVTSNDGAGYSLTVDRTAFTPDDLPLSLKLGATSPPLVPAIMGAAAIPVSPAADLNVGHDNGMTSESGDVWPASFVLGPLPFVRAGAHTATVTVTVIGN